MLMNDKYGLILLFEDSLVLHIFANRAEKEYEQWMLFTPDRMVLCAGPSKKLTYESLDATPKN